MTTREKVIKLIRHEHSLRPKAELFDYYKLFYQGAFGPGHMVNDLESAKQFLMHELLSMQGEPSQEDLPMIEDIGWRGKYSRVNLHAITNGNIELDAFLHAFVESANVPPPVELIHWRKMWTEISTILYSEHRELQFFEEQAREIEEAFELENPLFHHSRTYRKLYHPHYRVLHADYLIPLQKEFI